MAEYYTHFSTAIDMPSAETAQAAVALLGSIEEKLYEMDPEQLPEEFAAFRNVEWFGDCAAVADAETLIVHDEAGQPNIEFVAVFAQEVIKRFIPEEAIGIEYACTCSRNRPDGFGGGTVLVTADTIEYKHTGEIIDEWKKRHRESRAIKTPDTKADFTCCKCGGADIDISVPAFFKINQSWEPSLIDYESEALTYHCNDCEEDVSIRTPGDGEIRTGRWTQRG